MACNVVGMAEFAASPVEQARQGTPRGMDPVFAAEPAYLTRRPDRMG